MRQRRVNSAHSNGVGLGYEDVIMWKMFSLDLILQCRMWPGKIIEEEIMSRLLVLMRVVTPEPREIEEEQRGVYGHRLQQELISVRS